MATLNKNIGQLIKDSIDRNINPLTKIKTVLLIILIFFGYSTK